MRDRLNLPSYHLNSVILVFLLDLFALIANYGLYSTNWIGQYGYSLSLPNTSARPAYISPHHITLQLFDDSISTCILGKQSIEIEQLSSELQTLQQNHQLEEILIMTSSTASSQMEKSVINMALELELKCTIIGTPLLDHD